MKPDDLDRPASVQVVATDRPRSWLEAVGLLLGGAGLMAGGTLLGMHLTAQRPTPTPPLAVVPPVVLPATDELPARLPPSLRPRVEVVFAIDTTGSMGGLLRAARQKAWSIVNALADRQVDLAVGLVAYRDRNDDYVTQVTPLTGDIDAFYQALHGLRAIGGGDRPESVAEALRVASRDAGWTQLAHPASRRLIIVIGDAPPRPGEPGVAEAAAARSHGISVSTVRIGDDPDAAFAFAAIAASGGGSALHVQPLSQGRLAEQVTTPYDAPIAAAQRRIEATVVPWGTAEQQHRVQAQQALNGSLGQEEYASRASAMCKTKGSYSHDLLQDLETGRVRRADVDLAQAPGLTGGWQEVDARLAARAAARAELGDLVARRDAWLRDNAGKTGVDAQLLECIERHALAR